jgi:hypothetical protein
MYIHTTSSIALGTCRLWNSRPGCNQHIIDKLVGGSSSGVSSSSSSSAACPQHCCRPLAVLYWNVLLQMLFFGSLSCDWLS